MAAWVEIWEILCLDSFSPSFRVWGNPAPALPGRGAEWSFLSSLLFALSPLLSPLSSPPLLSSLSTLLSEFFSLLSELFSPFSAVDGECRSFQQVPVVFEACPTAGPWSHWGLNNSKIPKIIRIYLKMDRRGYLARLQWPLDSWYLLCLLSMLQSHP